MTTIGSTNPYHASLLAGYGKNGGDRNTSGGGDYTAPRQSSPGSVTGGVTGSDTVFGARLAGALWSMESQGVDLNQTADDAWLGEPRSTTYEDEFTELSRKTFAERIREQYLDKHGLTEGDLKAMSQEDRDAVEAEIRKAILEATGVNGRKQEADMEAGAANPAAPAPVGTARQGTRDDPLFSL
ncbi:hypothetical protein ACFFP0_21425 [Rhizobium puerariae]|uniref:Uncharacterized protein n=1 Tax=Rhizobium puerariae TaxID=1585791 RepID=A0ABV6ANX5_9HYPH